jgi:hypothetical protein
MITSNALVADPRRPFAFRVPDVLALAELRMLVTQCVSARHEDGTGAATSGAGGSKGGGSEKAIRGEAKWPQITDRLNRQLLDYQQATVGRMAADKSAGHSAHFLNIKVGLGKTLIFLSYLKHRGLRDVRHVVYTMPKSAFGGVIRFVEALHVWSPAHAQSSAHTLPPCLVSSHVCSDHMPLPALVICPCLFCAFSVLIVFLFC